MKRAILVFIAIIHLTACATAPLTQSKYVEGATTPYETAIVIDQPFDQVWDKLVSELSQRFYVINNINKESRLLNVSYTINKNGNPENYVDCGRQSIFFNLANRPETFEFAVAESSIYKWTSGVAYDQHTFYDSVVRNPSLVGRANVYVAPGKDGNETKMSVNVVYTFTVSEKRQSVNYNAFSGKFFDYGFPTTKSGTPITFFSNKEGFDETGVVRCFPTGKFEADILSIFE
jgi:hypothetical protein